MILRATPFAHMLRVLGGAPRDADNPPAANDPAETHMDNGEAAATRSSDLVRATMATVLIAGAIAALAITSLIHSHDRATAQSHVPPAPAARS